MTSAILFDLDGTLLDTLEDIADAMNYVLGALGHAAHPLDAYRRFVGEGVRLLVQRALPEAARDERTIERGVALMKERYGTHLFNKTQPYRGIEALLAELDARALPLAVLSNKLDEPTRLLVDHFFGVARFAAVRGQRDGVPRKPDPTAALEIAHELEIAPGEWLYLGDTPTDMQTAASAGMVAVGVAWGFRSPDELVRHGADHVITTPDELCSLLLERRPV